VWGPTLKADVLHVAVDPLMGEAAQYVVAPSVNATVPVAPLVTVAVKVTDCPYTDGLPLVLAAVTVSPLITVCTNVALDP